MHHHPNIAATQKITASTQKHCINTKTLPEQQKIHKQPTDATHPEQ